MTLPVPNATYSEDVYRFSWPVLGIDVLMERFSETKDSDVRVEATVNLAHALYGGRLYSGRLLLIGPNSRRDVRNALSERTKDLAEEIDWGGILEQVCNLARERYRRGEPIVDLTAVEFSERPRFLYPPFVVANGISIHYGDGKTMKSLLEMHNCVQLALQGIKSLYLDWEDDQETHAERLAAVCAGLGVEPITLEGMIHYQRRSTRLQDSTREIRRAIAEISIDHSVVDSLGMAAGDPNDHGLVIEAVRAARSLGVAVSCVHHLPKDAKDKTKPFGSVYASNEARLTWLFEKVQEEGSNEISLLLTNQAFNRGMQQLKRGYKVRFTNDGDALACVEFIETDVGQLEGFRHRKPQHMLIAEALKANGRLQPADIASVLEADGVNISRQAISSLLKRHEGKHFTRLESGYWGALQYV